MSILTFDVVKKAVLDAGFEMFRAKGSTIQLAERVRSHLMDAQVSVHVADAITVSFIVRSQRSDFPTDGENDLFARVRRGVEGRATTHGFRESSATSRTLHDPVDASRVLDVWHELTFSKSTTDLTTLIADLRCALTMPKCVTD